MIFQKFDFLYTRELVQRFFDSAVKEKSEGILNEINNEIDSE